MMNTSQSASPRCHRLAAFMAAVAVISSSGSSVDAFATPSASQPHQMQTSLLDKAGRRSSTFLAASSDENEHEVRQSTKEESVNPFFTEFARPAITMATSAFLAASLLFSTPLLPPPDAIAASSTTQLKQQSSKTATSIDIDLRSVPALTRKIITNRDKLTDELINSFKSFKPVLQLLSESDTVTVKPPKDVKGAINAALTKGDAQFIVNGENVDVRVESVPGVIVVRVINPNIPRLPFLRDGTAALKFVDGIVDEAPVQLEKAAEEIQAVEKFLMWGAPEKAPITYKGSSLDYFLSSKFKWDGESVSLGALGDLTNSEVVLLGVGTGVFGAYSASYGYYIKLQEDAEKEAAEKKAVVAAKAKAKKEAAAKKTKKEADTKKKETVGAEEEAKKKEVYPPKPVIIDSTAEEDSGASVESEAKETTTANDDEDDDEQPKKGRKRDAFKNLFKRGKE